MGSGWARLRVCVCPAQANRGLDSKGAREGGTDGRKGMLFVCTHRLHQLKHTKFAGRVCVKMPPGNAIETNLN